MSHIFLVMMLSEQLGNGRSSLLVQIFMHVAGSVSFGVTCILHITILDLCGLTCPAAFSLLMLLMQKVLNSKLL